MSPAPDHPGDFRLLAGEWAPALHALGQPERLLIALYLASALAGLAAAART